MPVNELLDADRGLGFPAGYRVPPSPRDPDHADPPDDGARLLALAQQAAMSGAREVVLDDRLAQALAPAEPGEPVGSFDLCMHLLAPSEDALGAGRFRLVATPLPAGSPAGSMSGRFAYLSEELTDQIARLARPAAPGVVPAQLVFEAGHARTANVARLPRVCDHVVPVGVFWEGDGDAVVDLDDLCVGADADGLYVFSRSLDAEVQPMAFHMINIWTLAPNLARLLVEIPRSRSRMWTSWNWGPARALPYLPRIRHGRTILASARWRPDPSLLDASLGFSRWRERFERWRADWSVPDVVEATGADHRIRLELDNALHLRLLRQDLSRRPHLLLFEQPAGGEHGWGWLAGHVSELVFSLSARRPPAPVASRRRPAPARTVDCAHAPGSDWLFAKLYAASERHDDLLVDHLPRLLAGLPPSADRWFFVRYRDRCRDGGTISGCDSTAPPAS